MVRATLGPRRPNVNFIEQTIKYFYTEDISILEHVSASMKCDIWCFYGG